MRGSLDPIVVWVEGRVWPNPHTSWVETTSLVRSCACSRTRQRSKYGLSRYLCQDLGYMASDLQANHVIRVEGPSGLARPTLAPA